MANLSVPIAAALLAALLLVFRVRRLAARPARPKRPDPRPRALAEAVASAMPVLLMGWGLSTWMPERLDLVGPFFALIAGAVCLSQYAMTMKALRRG